MEELQRNGIPSYPAKDTRELLTDAHMEARTSTSGSSTRRSRA